MDNNSNNSDKALGIDLGTTNSVPTGMVNGRPDVLLNISLADCVIPSCVYYSENSNRILVGAAAAAKKASNPANTIYDTKRLIGRQFNDEEVHQFIGSVGFAVVNSGGRPHIQLKHNGQNKLISAEENAANILRTVKEMAEVRLSGRSDQNRVQLTKAVITVPAKFNMPEKLATKKAAELAGFVEVQLRTEPAAAACLFAFQHNRYDGYNMLVYDFGGGTLDLNIVSVKNGEFTVEHIGGDRTLGGREIDLALREYCVKEILDKFGNNVVLRQKRETMQALLEKCELAKKLLSESDDVEINFDFLGHIDESITITRAVFEAICRPILLQSMEMVQNLMNDAGLTVERIDEVLLVGGTSYIPLVAELLELECGFPAEKLNRSLNRMHAVALGAAVLASQMEENNANQMPFMRLVEAIPLPIGIRDLEDTFQVLIPRNTSIPCDLGERMCATTQIDQCMMSFAFYEGERKIASQNKKLGEFWIRPLSKGNAGEVFVTLNLKIDRNGIFHAIATHNELLATLDLEYMTIRTEAQNVREAIREAELHAEADSQENSREAAKYDLIMAVQQAKYKCTNEGKLNLCGEFEQWIGANGRSTAVQFRAKLDEFRRRLNALA